MQKIIPCLWFDVHAEEAVNRLVSTFNNSTITTIQRYPDAPLDIPMQGMEGKVLTAIFELDGFRFMALDGGPQFKFSPAISFFINCESEAEIDHIWQVLSEDGMVLMPFQEYPFSKKFGWVNDKYGVSWQLTLNARAKKFTPFLTFVGEHAGKAEEAMQLYTSLFPNSGIEMVKRYEAGNGGGAEGTLQYGLFRLHNQEFMAVDSNYEHQWGFTEAVSLYVECETQEEIDHLWNALSAVPEAEACGWLKDKYGVSWQIIPKILGELIQDPDPEKSKRALDAMLQMKKFDIEALKQAHAG